MTGIGNLTEDGLELDSHRSMTYSVLYGCILALGFPLNAVSLWILVRRHRIKSPGAVFMINLALSDLLLVISLPLRVYFYATGSWPLDITACTVATMFWRNNIRSSAVFITFISVDRLLAVVYPLRSGLLRTTTNAWRACAFVWVLKVSGNIPESVHFTRTMESCNQTACFALRACRGEQSVLSMMSVVIGYIWRVLLFAMLAVNVVSTAMVYWTLRRHLNDSARINNKMNVMLIFAMNLLMFVICFMPLNLAIIVKWRSAIEPTSCLCSVNCCLDPLLYYFSMDAFWKKQENVDAREQLAAVGEDDAHRVQGNL